MQAQLALARRVAMALIVIGVWQGLATNRVQAGVNQWTSNRPDGGPVYTLALHPQTATTVYAGTCGGGVFKSTDGGATWSASGLTDASVLALALDPQTPTTLYAGTYGGGVFKSTDGGTTWSAMNAG